MVPVCRAEAQGVKVSFGYSCWYFSLHHLKSSQL
jgi:hypothetical protein